MTVAAKEAVESVDAINRVFGAHEGTRAAHARGSVCRGVFTPTEEAGELTRAAHMQEQVNVTVRFSNASGDPGTADGDRDVRGMAVKFHLPDGNATDIVAVTLPCFFVSEPEDFIKLNRAFGHLRNGRPSPLGLVRVAGFYIAHKEARRALRSALRPNPVASYENCRYNGIHAFKWSCSSDDERFIRYSWRPEGGEKTIAGSDAKKRPRDYLQQDLYGRLGRVPVRPIRFTLELQVASEEDLRSGRVCNPTAVWPGKRGDEKQFEPAGGGSECPQFVDAGVLELTGLADSDDPLIFDPTRLTEGIEEPVLGNGIKDEILHFRPKAYDVSFKRRTNGVAADRP